MAKKRARTRRATARKSAPKKKKPWVKARSKRKSSFASLPASAKRAAFAKMGGRGKLFKRSKTTGKRSRALGRKRKSRK